MTALTWAAGVVCATSVWRNLRRARRIACLEPPAAQIDLVVDAPGAPGRHPIQLVALGDSAIAGVGADCLQGCMAVQIAERVAVAACRPVRIRGYGVSGARTADVAGVQVQALDPTGPSDVAIVVVGTNDVAHCTPPWRYRRDVAHLHRALRERLGVPVIYCSLPEFRAITVVGGPLRLLLIAYGRVLGRMHSGALAGRPGAWWVDARRTAGPAFLRQPDAMSSDGYHPSTRGYGLLADALAPAVIAALGDRDVTPDTPPEGGEHVDRPAPAWQVAADHGGDRPRWGRWWSAWQVAADYGGDRPRWGRWSSAWQVAADYGGDRPR